MKLFGMKLFGVVVLFLTLFIQSVSGQQTQTINGIGLMKIAHDATDIKNRVPIIYFHGTSSSKLEPLLVKQSIKRKGRTIVAFDRPGYGHSSPVIFGNLNDYTTWCQTHLIPAIEECLGYKPAQYDLVTVSGGTQYGLKMAQVIPDRIRNVTVISAGLFGRPVGAEGQYERARKLAANRPQVSNLLIQIGKRNPDRMQEMSSKKFSAPDKRFVECHRELGQRILLDATRCGANGISQDARMQLCDTSYAAALPASIKVTMWNGMCDNTISQASANLLAQRLGLASHFIANEGHLSCIPIAFESGVISNLK